MRGIARIRHLRCYVCRSCRQCLFDLGAAVIFFGLLVGNRELELSATAALRDLEGKGYQVPTIDAPVRVYPQETGRKSTGRELTGQKSTGQELSSAHAGGWRPGVIELRLRPQGNYYATTYLRHELFHEASYRTCQGRVPLWLEEAGAMVFAGEVGLDVANGAEDGGGLSGDRTVAFDALRKKVKLALPLNGLDRALLKALVIKHGWREEPCSAQPQLTRVLEGDVGDATGRAVEGGGMSYLVMSVASGRVLERGGDIDALSPPGSLLKIPYVASLNDGAASPEEFGDLLARSDTVGLLRLAPQLDAERASRLYGMMGDRPELGSLKDGVKGEGSSLFASGYSVGSSQVSYLASCNESCQRELLGERRSDRVYPYMTGLRELGLVVRAAIQLEPERFVGLDANGRQSATTLFATIAGNSEWKEFLSSNSIGAKTGTASDSRNTPLVGHLMFLWPTNHPRYLALFRTERRMGAEIFPQAYDHLRKFIGSHPISDADVRVVLLKNVKRADYRVQQWFGGVDKLGSFCRDGLWSDSGSGFGRELMGRTPSGRRVLYNRAEVLANQAASGKGGAEDCRRVFSDCGELEIVSRAKNGKSRRIVRGVIEDCAGRNTGHDSGQISANNSSRDSERNSVDKSGVTVLTTDVDSYVEGVVESEGGALTAETKRILAAVVYWNATRGEKTLPELAAFCDTQRSQVFQGRSVDVPAVETTLETNVEAECLRSERLSSEQLPSGPTTSGQLPSDQLPSDQLPSDQLPSGHVSSRCPQIAKRAFDKATVELLDVIAARRKLRWLKFSRGGREPWTRDFPMTHVKQVVADEVLDVLVINETTGKRVYQFIYASSEEFVSCELLQKKFTLPSCPDAVTFSRNAASEDILSFSGRGQGHGDGLDLLLAEEQLRHGASAEAVVHRAFGS